VTTVQKKDHSRAENISNQHPAEIEKHHRPPIVLLSETNPPRSQHEQHQEVVSSHRKNRLRQVFTFAAAANNLVRIRNLAMQAT
jgi:hypothetical protein